MKGTNLAAENLQLHKVTIANWEAVANLKVRPDQANFLTDNMYSIAQSKYEPYYIPTAIYLGRTPIGFVMYGHDANDGRYWITRIMFDEKYQGKGYGKKALTLLLDRLSEFEDCSEVYTCYVKGNETSKHVFEKIGFIPNGEILHSNQIVLVKKLK